MECIYQLKYQTILQEVHSEFITYFLFNEYPQLIKIYYYVNHVYEMVFILQVLRK